MKSRTALLVAIVIGSGFPLKSLAQIKHLNTRIVVKVVDEEGTPIADAQVGVAFGREGQLNKSVQLEGNSDSGGVFTARSSSDGHVFWGAEKSGYYGNSGNEFLFNRALAKDGKWQPSDLSAPTVLRKKVHPVAAYRKAVNSPLPDTGKPIGFDLLAGDWVVPYGRGQISDFVFFAEYERRSDYEYDFALYVRFSNPADGIQVYEGVKEWGYSEFQWPYTAPEDGYLAEWVQRRSRGKEGGEAGNRDPKRKYLFRVRTVHDEAGNIKSAYYGRISGDFMDFTYALNPTPNDRNVEFDPKQNLFTNLSSREAVRAP